MNQILKSLKNPIVQQYGLELLFPVIGYLFFGWSFLLIVLFYLVDQFGNQVNFFARLNFVQKLYLPKKNWLFPVSIIAYAALYTAELALIYFLFNNYIYDCQDAFFFDELRAFFLQEFWLFLPLLILVNYFKDKMTFYKTELPYQESPEKMVIFNTVGLLASFVLIGIVLLIWLAFKPSLLILVIVIALFKLLNDAFLMPELKLRYFKKI